MKEVESDTSGCLLQQITAIRRHSIADIGVKIRAQLVRRDAPIGSGRDWDDALCRDTAALELADSLVGHAYGLSQRLKPDELDRAREVSRVHVANIEPKVTSTQALKVPLCSETISSMTDEDELRAFATRVNEICDEMGVPPKGKARQTDVGKIFGVSQKGARKWLEGEGYCTIAMGKRIAAWAGVSFDWLMTGTLPKRPDETHPLLARYRSADPATRALIDLALNQPADDVPESLSDSLRALVTSARDYIEKQISRR